MDIAGLSTVLAATQTQEAVGVKVLKEQLDTSEVMGNAMIDMMNRSMMELSVNPNLGGNIDISVQPGIYNDEDFSEICFDLSF